MEYLDSRVQADPLKFQRLANKKVVDSSTQECPVQVCAYEPSLFSLDMENVISVLYRSSDAGGDDSAAVELNEANDMINSVAFRILTALIAMNEAPYVRYQNGPRGHAKQLAETLASNIRKYQKANPSWVPIGAARSDDMLGSPVREEPATVLIVDRVDDIASALIHSTAYNALIMDLLHHTPSCPLKMDKPLKIKRKDGKEEKGPKEVLLDETDAVWRHLRNLDMADVIEAVVTLKTDGAKREAAQKISDEKDVKEMRKLMQVIASDDSGLVSKINLHNRIKLDIESRFEKRNMHDIIELEMKMITGVDQHGDKVSWSQLEESLEALLVKLAGIKDTLRMRLKSGEKKDTDEERLKPMKTAIEEDQMRLLIVFILCNKKMDLKTVKRMEDAANLDEKQATTIRNLLHLDVPLERKEKDRRAYGAPLFTPEVLADNKDVAKSTQNLFRYKMKVHRAIDQMVAGSLSDDSFPWIKAPKKGAAAGAGVSSPTGVDAAAVFNTFLGAAHGEYVNKYAVDAINNARDNRTAATGAGKRGKESKFAKADTMASPAADATLFDQLVAPPRPRNYQGGRIIVFFLGGVSQTEVSSIEKLSRLYNREIIVGTTSLLTPGDFLEQLYAVEKPIGDDDWGSAGAFPEIDVRVED